MMDSPGIHLPKNIFHPKKKFPVFIPKIDRFFEKSHNHVKEEIFRSKKNLSQRSSAPAKNKKKTTPKKILRKGKLVLFLFTQN